MNNPMHALTFLLIPRVKQYPKKSYRLRSILFTPILLSLLSMFVLWGCSHEDSNPKQEPKQESGPNSPEAPEPTQGTQNPEEKAQGVDSAAPEPISPESVTDATDNSSSDSKPPQTAVLEKEETLEKEKASDLAEKEVVVSEDEKSEESAGEVGVVAKEETETVMMNERQRAISELSKQFPTLDPDSPGVEDRLRALLWNGIQLNEDLQTITSLIRAQTDINWRDDHGRTVLSYAASVTEDPETVIPLLLKAGADVNTTDFTGATPIMYAAFQSPNPAATVRVLLGRGASLAIKDTTGRTALDFAQLNPEKSAETISVLKSFRTPNAAGFTHNQPLPARQ